MNVSPPQRRWPPDVPDAVWAPLVAAVLTLIAGMLGVIADQPWLFPSLGPTAFLQAEAPEHRMSRFTNTVIGHLVGLGVGYLAIALFGAKEASSVLATSHLTSVRIWASALAIAVTILVGILWRISHPPASATTL